MTRWISGLSKLFADARYARKVTSTSDPTSASDSAAGFRVGDIWVNTATGNIWTCYDHTAGAAKWRHQPRILGQGVGPADHTGDTNETKVASVLIPAGAMGANGKLSIDVEWSNNNSGNNKTRNVRFGAADDLAGTLYSQTSVTTTLNSWFLHKIQNLNAANAQQGGHAAGSAGGPGSFAGAAITSSIDTTAAAYLVFSVTLANSGDSCGLDHYSVLLTRPDIT